MAANGNPMKISKTLEDLHMQISSVKCEVYEAIRAFYTQNVTRSLDEAVEFANSWSCKSIEGTNSGGIQHRMTILEEKLTETVSYLQDDEKDVHGNLIKTINNYNTICSQIENSKEVLAVLRILCEIDGYLNQFDDCYNSKDYIRAAETVLLMEEQLEAIRTNQDDQSNEKIVTILRRQVQKRKSRVLFHVKELLSMMILVDYNNRSLTITRELNFPEDINQQPVLLANLFKALKVLKLFNCWLKETISSSLLDSFFQTLFQANEFCIKSEILNESTKKYFCSSMCSSSTFCSLESSYERIIEIVELIVKDITCSSEDITLEIGNIIWKGENGNKGFQYYLEKIMKEAIPDEIRDLQEFQDLQIHKYRVLKERLLSLNFINGIEKDDLQVFIEDIPRKFEEKKRNMLLVKARNILCGEYQNDQSIKEIEDMPIRTGSELKSHEIPIFRLPCTRITLCSHKLVQLAYEILAKTCDVEERYAIVLYHTSRDIINLFRAIIPVLHQNNITENPRICMLFHNDCMYIAHNLLTIIHQHRASLPPDLAKVATMVDMVPLFRRDAENALIKYSTKQCTSMLELLKKSPNLLTICDESNFIQVEKSYKELLKQSFELANIWKDGLDKEIYSKVFGVMWTAILKNILSFVFSLNAIPAKIALPLQSLLSLLLEFQVIFDSPEQAAQHVNNFNLFKVTISLLDEPLSSIIDQCKNGDFASFSSSEIIGLIRAIYQDSPARAEAIRILEIHSN